MVFMLILTISIAGSSSRRVIAWVLLIVALIAGKVGKALELELVHRVFILTRSLMLRLARRFGWLPDFETRRLGRHTATWKVSALCWPFRRVDDIRSDHLVLPFARLRAGVYIYRCKDAFIESLRSVQQLPRLPQTKASATGRQKEKEVAEEDSSCSQKESRGPA